MREELNTISEASSHAILGLILKFYNYLPLWEESPLEEILAFNWIHLYSYLKWNEFKKAYNFVLSIFGKSFKIIQEINFFDKFCLKIFTEEMYFGGKRIELVKTFGLKYLYSFTSRKNIFSIKNYISWKESIKGIDNFQLINYKKMTWRKPWEILWIFNKDKLKKSCIFVFF